LEAGESLGTGVHRLSSLQRIRAMITDAMTPDTVVIGGDCSVTVAALDAIDTDDLALVWFDAHPDLHTDETSPSGAFSGMALRAILGEGERRLALSPALPAERVVVVGARVLDAAEEDPLSRLAQLSVGELDDERALADAVARTGAARVWVHIDVDVLDPTEMAGVSTAAPFGATAAALVSAVRALRGRVPLAGATIAGFAPRSPLDAVDDLGAILRLVAAVA
jgi:arginase